MATEASEDDYPECLTIEPKQFRIEVKLNTEQLLMLTLTNTTDGLVAFKVKTTAPDRYLVRPTQEVILPQESKQCKIVLTRMQEYPDASNPKNLKDKFLVQSMRLAQVPEDLSKLWKEKERAHNPKKHLFQYHDDKIRCKLAVPAKVRAEAASQKGQEEAKLIGDANKTEAQPTPAVTGAQQPTVNGGSSAMAEQPVSQAITSSTPSPTGAGSAAPRADKEAPVPDTRRGPGSGSTTAASTASPRQQHRREPTPSSLQNMDIDMEEYQEAVRKAKEYDELMTFCVKMTTENEKLKSEIKRMSERHTQAMATNEGLQKRLQDLQAQFAMQESPEGRPDGLRKRDGDPRSAADRERERLSPAELSKERDKEDSGGLHLQTWQLILLAVVFFIVGRILA